MACRAGGMESPGHPFISSSVETEREKGTRETSPAPFFPLQLLSQIGRLGQLRKLEIYIAALLFLPFFPSPAYFCVCGKGHHFSSSFSFLCYVLRMQPASGGKEKKTPRIGGTTISRKENIVRIISFQNIFKASIFSILCQTNCWQIFYLGKVEPFFPSLPFPLCPGEPASCRADATRIKHFLFFYLRGGGNKGWAGLAEMVKWKKGGGKEGGGAFFD